MVGDDPLLMIVTGTRVTYPNLTLNLLIICTFGNFRHSPTFFFFHCTIILITIMIIVIVVVTVVITTTKVMKDNWTQKI